MDKCALYGQKVHFMDKKCCFMDRPVIYGQKVLLLGLYGKFGSPHGKKITSHFQPCISESGALDEMQSNK
jgi:hypothetical protein